MKRAGALVAAGVVSAAGMSVRADGVARAEPAAGVAALRGGVVDARARRGVEAGARAGWHLLVLDGPLTEDRRAALVAAGARLGDVIPRDSVAAELSNVAPGALRALGFVRWAEAWRAEWKADGNIGKRAWNSASRRALSARGEVGVLVHLFPGESAAAVERVRGARVVSRDVVGGSVVLGVTAPAGMVGAIAGLAGVQMVEDAPEFEARSLVNNRWIVQTNITGSTPFYSMGINGTGSIVSVIDDPMSTTHCAFLDAANPIGPTHRKIAAYNAPISSSPHGTQVAGIVAGFDAGNAFNNATGVAFGSRIVFNTFPVPLEEPAMRSRFELHASQGAFIHNNSYGQNFETAYTGACRAIDDFLWNNNDQLLVFAVSNEAVVYTPENAKNALAVGGSNGSPNQQSWRIGGAGPTSDGRRKPDLIAPGVTQAPSGNACFTLTSPVTGTSFAAPMVSGAAVLAREYFARGFFPTGTARPEDAFEPTGMLLKAALANGAQDTTDSGYPGVREGWGRVLLDETFFFPGDARKMDVLEARNNAEGALRTGESRSILVRSVGPSRLRVTLTWYDAPASVSAAFAPINDLDLRVVGPDGTVYLGNVFVNGSSAPGGARDALNNLEQVHIHAPAAGVWRVEVVGASVSVGAQGFGLIVSGAIERCLADRNRDGMVDGEDLVDFLDLFDAQSDGADLSRDGAVDLEDFFLFFSGLDAGC